MAEIAIPVIAFGGAYVMSKMNKKDESIVDRERENFTNMGEPKNGLAKRRVQILEEVKKLDAVLEMTEPTF